MTSVTTVDDRNLINRFKMDKSQRFSLLALGLVLSQVAKYIGDGAYFTVFQMRWAAEYPKGNATYGDWYLTDWYDRFPVHLQNLLGVHWFASQAAPAWWETDRHLTRGIIIGLVAAALVQSLTVGLKTKPLGKFGLLFSPLLIAAIVLPLTALGVYILTEVVPSADSWGTAGSIPYLGDWLAAGNWQSIVLGFVALWPAKRIIKRIGATLQIASIDNKLLRMENERAWWRFTKLPNWLQRFRFTLAQTELPDDNRHKHTPRDHGKIVGFILTVTILVSMYWFVVGILVTTVGPASHH